MLRFFFCRIHVKCASQQGLEMDALCLQSKHSPCVPVPGQGCCLVSPLLKKKTLKTLFRRGATT